MQPVMMRSNMINHRFGANRSHNQGIGWRRAAKVGLLGLAVGGVGYVTDMLKPDGIKTQHHAENAFVALFAMKAVYRGIRERLDAAASERSPHIKKPNSKKRRRRDG